MRPVDGRAPAAYRLGLPGNPVSAIVCTHLARPADLRAMGQPTPDRIAQSSRLTPGPHRAHIHYMRARRATTCRGSLRSTGGQRATGCSRRGRRAFDRR
jgi:molybdopterin biosynthesis enzyme